MAEQGSKAGSVGLRETNRQGVCGVLCQLRGSREASHPRVTGGMGELGRGRMGSTDVHPHVALRNFAGGFTISHAHPPKLGQMTSGDQ